MLKTKLKAGISLRNFVTSKVQKHWKESIVKNSPQTRQRLWGETEEWSSEKDFLSNVYKVGVSKTNAMQVIKRISVLEASLEDDERVKV